MGDGFRATFDGLAPAVLCVCPICPSLVALGIDVRAGLHTGEIEPEGDDIAGVAVAIGVRVDALAGQGEVFVSSTGNDLVVGSGLASDDRGEHVLMGAPDAWRLFAAAETDCRESLFYIRS